MAAKATSRRASSAVRATRPTTARAEPHTSRGRAATRPPRATLLHVTNGESAGNTLRRTTLGGAVLSWQDALHAGPVPSAGRAALLRARAEFLSGCGWGRRSALLSSLERRDRLYLDALRNGAQVVLWLQHDLYDDASAAERASAASAS